MAPTDYPYMTAAYPARLTGDTIIDTSDGQRYYVRCGEPLPTGVDPMRGKFAVTEKKK